jgi:hypothetical protein
MSLPLLEGGLEGHFGGMKRLTLVEAGDGKTVAEPGDASRENGRRM